MVSYCRLPQFFRETLTRGTRMFNEWSKNGLAFSAGQKMAFKFLATPSRKLYQWGGPEAVAGFYQKRQLVVLPEADLKEMRYLLEEMYLFDNSFSCRIRSRRLLGASPSYRPREQGFLGEVVAHHWQRDELV
ncbi:hypothetical protein J1614_007457 [Plenodomus biglobosus]|nr:hypothetical protein J1614_007457 [Plenodomus biglobosus]